MAKSIRQQLDGNLPDLVEDVRRYGIWGALEKWGLEKSYLPVRKIILEETGDENFGVNPAAGSYTRGGIKGLLREFISAFADYVVKTDRENKALKRELEVHRLDTDKIELEVADEMVGLIEVLKSSVPEK